MPRGWQGLRPASLRCAPAGAILYPWPSIEPCEGGSENNGGGGLVVTKITLNGMMTAGKVAWGLAQYAKAASAPAPEIKRADPMEGLARASELEKYRYSPDGFYLGKIHPDHGVNFGASLPANDDRHVFIVAGTGAGKGVTIGT